ncbi:MAG: DNA gyrase inhibitor YacG [Gammaproteobacteria bacterium]|nr:DNA gyrase inhibitor YacG [Gammaproteobacteria bacterium]
MKPVVKCPGCGKQIEWSEENQWRPFCSERCKLIDLGAWANEDHAIPGKPVNPWEQNEDGNKQE